MKFKIKTNDLADVGSVLMRDRIPYNLSVLSVKEAEIDADIIEERFNEVLVDAECEREMRGRKMYVPVYSMKTIENPEKLIRLQRHYRANDIDIPRERMPIFPLVRESAQFREWLTPDRPWMDPDEWSADCEELIIGLHRIYLMESLFGPINDRTTAYRIAGWPVA